MLEVVRLAKFLSVLTTMNLLFAGRSYSHANSGHICRVLAAFRNCEHRTSLQPRPGLLEVERGKCAHALCPGTL